MSFLFCYSQAKGWSIFASERRHGSRPAHVGSAGRAAAPLRRWDRK